MGNFGPTNPHGTAFARKQWLDQKEVTSMESSKMECPSRCRTRSYQGGDANYPRFMGSSIEPRMEIWEISRVRIPIVPCLHQSNCYIKRYLRVWIAKKCNALVGAESVLTSAGPQTNLFHGGQ